MIAQETKQEITQEQVLKLLSDHIVDPDTQWSLGTFGGIAEFSRDPDEAVKLTTSDTGVAAVTARGAITITLQEELRPFASESITKQSWSHRVALCLPKQACVMNRRSVLTELGTDIGALREEDRQGVLFDIGSTRCKPIFASAWPIPTPLLNSVAIPGDRFLNLTTPRWLSFW
jgi:hypothetical protein